MSSAILDFLEVCEIARRQPKPKEPNVLIDFGEANDKQRLFYLSQTLYTAYGGARGGGKSHAVRIKSLGGALEYPGITILILRRTYNDLQNSIIEPMLKMIPQGMAVYNGTMHMIYFLNGSTIKFGHYDSDAHREYQGQQYDWIFIDEATQFTYDEFRTLGGCLRGVNDIPKRFYLTCNPGGVGHAWVKRLFIDRDYINDKSNPEANENPDDYTFIFATVEDNAVLLENSPQYLQMLASLPEDIRRAHRYGDWDALAGQYFSEFRKDTHTIEPFKIPNDWVRYRAFDYGLDMFACLWVAVDFSGRCYVYREARMKRLIVSEAAQLMHEMTLPDERIEYTIAPPDMWSTQKDTGKTMADLWRENGVAIVRGNNSRVQGWLNVKEHLKLMPDGKPGLLIFNDCRGIVDDLPSLQHDNKNPSDVAKEPHDITHAPDALRYFCQSRTMPSFKDEPTHIYDDEDAEDYDEAMTGGEATNSYLNY